MVPSLDMCRSIISLSRITSNVEGSPVEPMKEGNIKKQWRWRLKAVDKIGVAHKIGG